MELQLEYKQDFLENNLVLWGDIQKNSYYKTAMIQQNQIPGLLMVRVMKVDENTKFQYRITNKNSLISEVKSHKISYCQLESFRKSLIKVTDSLKEYLLDIEDLILKPEFIFVESKTWEFFYCYFPDLQGNTLTEICNLMEYLIKEIDHQDKRAVQLGYQMYHLASEPNCSIQDFEKIRIAELNAETPRNQGKNQKEVIKQEETEKNNYKRSIKGIVIFCVISIIILMVGIILYLAYIENQLF